ncbi:MAG: hypothetical protein PHE73_08660 [Sulfurovaceae bacterium]|nr:hypothetical protein [Sulfurovaceae bacterium]
MASKYIGWLQTTVYLKPEEHAFLKIEMIRKGTSINKYIRELILNDLDIKNKLKPKK